MRGKATAVEDVCVIALCFNCDNLDLIRKPRAFEEDLVCVSGICRLIVWDFTVVEDGEVRRITEKLNYLVAHTTGCKKE